MITSPSALQYPGFLSLLFSQPSLSAGPWLPRSGNFSFHSPAVFQLCSLSFGQSSQTPPGHLFKVHVAETERTISRPYRSEWPRHPSRYQAGKPGNALLPSHPINPSPRPVHSVASAAQDPLLPHPPSSGRGGHQRVASIPGVLASAPHPESLSASLKLDRPGALGPGQRSRRQELLPGAPRPGLPLGSPRRRPSRALESGPGLARTPTHRGRAARARPGAVLRAAHRVRLPGQRRGRLRNPPPGSGLLLSGPRTEARGGTGRERAVSAPEARRQPHLDPLHAGLQLELLHQALQGAHAGPGRHGGGLGYERTGGRPAGRREAGRRGTAPGRGSCCARPAARPPAPGLATRQLSEMTEPRVRDTSGSRVD